MRNFSLRGLAEGVAGRSSIMAKNLEHVFEQLPALAAIRNKLTVNNDTIVGFSPCDG